VLKFIIQHLFAQVAVVRQTETAALRKAGKASTAKNKTIKAASVGNSNSNTFARGVVGVFSPGMFESVLFPYVFCCFYNVSLHLFY